MSIRPGDISSLSGSDSSQADSDNDDHLSPYSDKPKMDRTPNSKESESIKSDEIAQQRSHPRVFFKNSQRQLISVFRCILHGKKNIPSSQSELISMATKLLTNPKWAIIMTGGGHFAAAVFNGSEMIAHKTFHRYTVRAKRGTAQGMRDTQQGGKQPKSAGASLRRYNEAALVQDVQDLLESWKDDIKSCQRIFLRAPTYNRGIFYGGKNPPFNKDDVRISSIPFPTRRATLKELHRIHQVLSSVQCHGEGDDAEVQLNKLLKMAAKSPQKSTVTKNTDIIKEGVDSVTEDFTKKTDVVEQSGETESDNEDTKEITLTYEEIEISTSHLKEFDCTKKPRRRRKKKTQQYDFGDDKLTHDLYTACKTGNTDKLELLLNEISCSLSTPKENDHESSKEISCSTPGKAEEISQGEKKTAIILTDEGQHSNLLVGENTENIPHHKTITVTEDQVPACENSVSTSHLNSETNGNNEVSVDRTTSTIEEKYSALTCQDDLNLSTKVIDPVSDVLNNAIDNKGATLLHVAAEAGHQAVLWLLLYSGADPGRRNKKGQSAYVLSANKEIRNEFRRFMATHPEKYDYTTSQIPSPLTTEMEEERAGKAAEKKKAQRKAKRAKQKVQMEEEKKKNAEEKEKMWFAGLSDREKRALAAESRLAKQHTSTEPSRSRCWLCGNDMAGKVPFEYLDFKFCSMKCLKQHKAAK